MKLCLDCKFLSLPSGDTNDAKEHGVCMHPHSIITNPVDGSRRQLLANDARQAHFSGCGLEARYFIHAHSDEDDRWLDKVFHKASHA